MHMLYEFDTNKLKIDWVTKDDSPPLPAHSHFLDNLFRLTTHTNTLYRPLHQFIHSILIRTQFTNCFYLQNSSRTVMSKSERCETWAAHSHQVSDLTHGYWPARSLDRLTLIHYSLRVYGNILYYISIYSFAQFDTNVRRGEWVRVSPRRGWGAEVPDPPPGSLSGSYDLIVGYAFVLCCANMRGLININ